MFVSWHLCVEWWISKTTQSRFTSYW